MNFHSACLPVKTRAMPSHCMAATECEKMNTDSRMVKSCLWMKRGSVGAKAKDKLDDNSVN